MDRGYEPHVDTGPPDDRRSDDCGRGPTTKWLILAFALMLLIVGPAYLWDHTREREAARVRDKSETYRNAAARLRKDAVAALPPDAILLEVTREEYPTGWLIFVRREGGKSIKFLVCYQRRESDGELSLSIARAD